MRILVQTICWNEEHMLPYFLRHYEHIAEKIIVYDNYSTDFSPVIADSHPKTELRFFDTDDTAHEGREVAVKEKAIENGRDYDWVITCDMDEFIWHPRLFSVLHKYKLAGITVPTSSYYHMVADEFPSTPFQIYNEVTRGFRGINKNVIFDPAGVDRINYSPGCHYCSPTGSNTTFGPIAGTWVGDKYFGGSRDGLKLFHMRLLGLQWMTERFQDIAERKSEYDKERNFGKQYFLTEKKLGKIFGECRTASRNVFGRVDGFYPNEYFV